MLDDGDHGIWPVITGLLLIALAVTGAAQTFPSPPPSNHLRIVTWNLEYFNDRSAKTSGAKPDRTPAQLNALAQRIKGFDAAIVALQEIDQIAALDDLRNRMGNSWAVFAGKVLGLFPQQNALLYEASKVDLLSAAFVHTHPNTNFTLSLYPTWTYRCPATGVFHPKGRNYVLVDYAIRESRDPPPPGAGPPCRALQPDGGG